MKEPFEKIATQKIRRFKYKESAPTVEEEQRNKYISKVEKSFKILYFKTIFLP